MVWHVQNYNFSSIYQQNAGLFYHKKTYNAVLHNCFPELKDNAGRIATTLHAGTYTLTYKPADGWHTDFQWRSVAAIFQNENTADWNTAKKSVQTQSSETLNIKAKSLHDVQKIRRFNIAWTAFIGGKSRLQHRKRPSSAPSKTSPAITKGHLLPFVLPYSGIWDVAFCLWNDNRYTSCQAI